MFIAVYTGSDPPTFPTGSAKRQIPCKDLLQLFPLLKNREHPKSQRQSAPLLPEHYRIIKSDAMRERTHLLDQNWRT